MKQIIYLTISFILFSSITTNATVVESCNFKTEVINTKRLAMLPGKVNLIPGVEDTATHVVSLKILKGKNMGSTVPDHCFFQKGKIMTATVEDREDFPIGSLVDLNYISTKIFHPQITSQRKFIINSIQKKGQAKPIDEQIFE